MLQQKDQTTSAFDHTLIVIYLQQLGYDKNSKFVQLSWNYMNDALRSNVFVRFTPESIACACIFLTGRMLRIPLPTSPAWYLLFDVSEADMLDICSTILYLYERPKVNIENLEKKVDALAQKYQESRNKAKPGATSPEKVTNVTTVPNPSSRPSSPIPKVDVEPPRQKESVDVVPRRRAADDNYYDHSGRKSRRDFSPPVSKKIRKSPSPITYHDSPPRHKHKKRKKSRYSSSGSRSRSRSRHHDRRDRKKGHRHDRSRSPYSPKRHHHSKKTHHYSNKH